MVYMVKVKDLSLRKQAAACVELKRVMDLPKTAEGDKAAERACTVLLDANVLDLGITVILAIEWVEVQDFMQAIDPNGDWENCPIEEAQYVHDTLTEWVAEGGIAKRVGDIMTTINAAIMPKEVVE
jgi:hypothetical protein